MNDTTQATRHLTTTTRSGQFRELDTPYTDEDALAKLRVIASRDHATTFQISIWEQLHRYGLRKAFPSAIFWMHQIVLDDETPKQEAPTAEVNLSGVMAILNTAKSNGLKRPKITLRTAQGLPVQLSIAGERSKTPGYVQVTDGGPYGANRWFGRISPEGLFSQSKQIVPEVVELLSNLGETPEAVASAHGHLTGACCFCNKELNTKDSLAVGYGPTCAKKFGLQWGKKSRKG